MRQMRTARNGIEAPTNLAMKYWMQGSVTDVLEMIKKELRKL